MVFKSDAGGRRRDQGGTIQLFIWVFLIIFLFFFVKHSLYFYLENLFFLFFFIRTFGKLLFEDFFARGTFKPCLNLTLGDDGGTREGPYKLLFEFFFLWNMWNIFSKLFYWECSFIILWNILNKIIWRIFFKYFFYKNIW